ncbi:MAG TPA: 3-dehydroquinate synthase [Chitinophagales bacterium]|nr:3-dehydroquinate synthase [Chitinophagales bacterium]HMU69017.1 3-dehydroquinate synthase [Chitinophagales bacterium]HMX03740.1 3-dehydroquinate synthase [Chitinophagales bacterium]HMZ89175.1 3-dehydroquinate synthase [Chitinophagales bacterium]HNA56831.1 3-dehydroquinate synthase [Chitinophagales bacterium]
MVLQTASYPIYIDSSPEHHGALSAWIIAQQYEQLFVLCDGETEKHCYPLLKPLLPEHQIFTIPSGEAYKNINTCITIWQSLAKCIAGRKSLLINLGGGVIGDMGGFAASTYKRGIDFIQIPTTLLSQVDASVGGKLGIDLDGVKNLVGVFRDPKAVFISPAYLTTLSERQVKSGFAEMLKHGFIADADYLRTLHNADLHDVSLVQQLIERSVRIKKDVVEKDPYEKGLRKILNFGHTIGHAVETWSLLNDEDPLLHGEAIAIGMICEAQLSTVICGFSESELMEVTNMLMHRYGKYPLEKVSVNALMDIMQLDKKNSQQKIRFSLLQHIGLCQYDLVATDDQIAAALQFYCGL